MLMSKVRYGVFFVLAATGLVILSCKKSTTQQTANNAVLTQAANTHFNITVYVSSHPNLLGIGGTDTIQNVGIRGLLIYRASTTTDPQFYVYERACTYDGTTNTKAVVAAPQGSFTCKDNICGSVFTIADGSGQPSHPPATYALKQYKYTYDGVNVLTITN
jgi:Rieske Fe-S protein